MSIREAVRALLFPFFRPSKASVEPVSRTDDPGAFVMLPSGLARVSPDGRIHPVPTSDPSPRGLFTGSVPQHPLAPEPSPPPLDWARWSLMQRQTFRRGWSFARYAVKGPNDRMACVFGIVRGAFGICTMDFYICENRSFDTLNAITHLPSGMGCGLFTDQESAAAACDIASRLDDWESFDPYADGAATTEAMRRAHTAWAAAGLTKCATHAHATADTNTTPVPIWFQDYSTIVAGRPEKLS